MADVTLCWKYPEENLPPGVDRVGVHLHLGINGEPASDSYSDIQGDPTCLVESARGRIEWYLVAVYSDGKLSSPSEAWFYTTTIPARLEGYVIDSESGEPIEGATVTVDRGVESSVTNPLGFYLFDYLPGWEMSIEVEAAGYLPQTTTRTFEEGEHHRLDFELLPTTSTTLSPTTSTTAS